jgi:hypothetical protein
MIYHGKTVVSGACRLTTGHRYGFDVPNNVIGMPKSRRRRSSPLRRKIGSLNSEAVELAVQAKATVNLHSPLESTLCLRIIGLQVRALSGASVY